MPIIAPQANAPLYSDDNSLLLALLSYYNHPLPRHSSPLPLRE